MFYCVDDQTLQQRLPMVGLNITFFTTHRKRHGKVEAMLGCNLTYIQPNANVVVTFSVSWVSAKLFNTLMVSLKDLVEKTNK